MFVCFFHKDFQNRFTPPSSSSIMIWLSLLIKTLFQFSHHFSNQSAKKKPNRNCHANLKFIHDKPNEKSGETNQLIFPYYYYYWSGMIIIKIFFRLNKSSFFHRRKKKIVIFLFQLIWFDYKIQIIDIVTKFRRLQRKLRHYVLDFVFNSKIISTEKKTKKKK